MADLGASFRQPFAEQLAAFRLRLGNLVPTSSWDDLQREAHDRAFVVAGATKADLLADLGKAVDKAIAQGTTFDTFKKDFRATVERHGWHGWTGEGTEAGETWRMRTIYRTNLRTSYMAGVHAQLVDGGFRFWVYRHSGALHPRLDHLSWDGIALSPAHDFWLAHFPPNGWGCGCDVVGANTPAGVRRVGGDPDKVLPANWDSTDRRTGTPPGIGKGWDYPPGGSVTELIQSLAPKVEHLPEPLSIDLMQSWLTDTLFGDWLRDPQAPWPLLRLPQQAADRIGAAARTAMLTPEVLARQMQRAPGLEVADYAAAQSVVREATRVLQPEVGRLVFIQDQPRLPLSIVEITWNGDRLEVTRLERVEADATTRADLIQDIAAGD